ncbi:MAG: carbohydrate kinase family protein [Roseiflexaceae bacterium]
MPDDYDVLLPGGYYCDLIFTGLPELPRLGADLFGTGFDMVPGACFYTVLALHRLGLRVGWACDFGDDCYSRFVLDAAAREGIDDRLFRLHARPLRRVSVSFSFAHDRGFISYKDEFASPSPIPIIERYRPRCLLLSYLHVGPQLHTLAATTHAYGGLVYMDCQARPETLADPQVVAAIRAIDIFAPNREEALQLTGASSVEVALARLAELVPLAVIKLGAEGAVARRGDQVAHAPGIPVAVVDTTGAGDCFNAGFLYGYLRGMALEDCLRRGNICGGLATAARGCGATPTAAQVEEMSYEF